MYREHFGLKEIPFSIAPDPRYLYMSEGHQEALAHLVYGMNSEGGFVLLTGEVGTGKTTICRCLLDQMPEDSDVAFILNPKLSAEELLASVCDEFGIRYPEGNTSVKVFIDHINAFLLDAHAAGRHTVLIIEEAQNLSSDVLEQIRLLTNLETNQRKLLQIVMLGQPELREKLSRPELRQLAQRITARYHLGPLRGREVKAYIAHRLSVAGTERQLFPPSVIDRVSRLSGGIPRLINVLCDRALLGAYVQGKDVVDKDTLAKAAREVFGDAVVHRGKKTYAMVIGGFLLLSVIMAFTAAFHSPKAKLQVKTAPARQERNQASLNLAGDPALNTKEKAFRALFKQLNMPISAQTEGAFCRQAQARGLRCLHKRGSFKGLRDLDRPAVLKLLNSQGKEFYVALTSLKGETATLTAGNDTTAASVNEIAQHWAGDYIVIWRAPAEIKGDIKPGSRKPSVFWLRKQLALINKRAFEPGRTPFYDATLVREVKDFQQGEGLPPDGIVGPETAIHLENAAGAAGTASMEKKKG